jgi:hypothetical protein
MQSQSVAAGGQYNGQQTQLGATQSLGFTVPHPAGDTLYATREGVQLQGAASIGTRYKVARGAPILQDSRLHSNFGFLANTVLADQVLQGLYIYPENMDTHTKLLLQDAQHIFHRLLKE